MQCENCTLDLQQLTCGHRTCSNCLELAIDLRENLDSAQADDDDDDWCPYCNAEGLEKVDRVLEVKKTSISKRVEQKKKELEVAAEKREQIIESVVNIRCTVESVLRQKELRVIETLEEAYEQLQTMVSEDLSKGEDELEAIDRFRKILPKTSTRKDPERSELSLSKEPSAGLDVRRLSLGPVSECYSLKLELDENFLQTITKLVSLPMGLSSLVVSSTMEDCSDTSVWFDEWELPLDMTSEYNSESFKGPDSCKFTGKRENSSEKLFLTAGEEINKKSPSSSTNAVCGSETEKRRLSSEASNISKCGTPLTPPTSDSGHSSVFNGSGLENGFENCLDSQSCKNSKLIPKLYSPDNPIFASKFMRSASTKIRNFLQHLRKSNRGRKCISGKKLSSYRTPFCQKRTDNQWSSPPASGMVRRKKLFPTTGSEGNSPVVQWQPSADTYSQTSTLSCAVFASLRQLNPEFDCNLPDVSVADPPVKLIEFNAVIDGEQSCWLIDIIFLPNERHLVVFDAINQNLKKFEVFTGKLSSVLRLSSEKSNMCVLTATCLAVTLPEAKQICFVDYSSRLKLKRKAKTDKVYVGITSLAEDRLVCASSSRDSCIDILSLDCEILASFSRKNLHGDAPLYPTYLVTTPDGKVLISDRIKRGLLCLNVIDSRVDFSYYGREDLSVTWPAGVACDQQGNIYLADCFQTKVHRLSPAGEFDSLFMSEADNIQMCRGVDIGCSGKLALTEYRHKTVKVFKLNSFN